MRRNAREAVYKLLFSNQFNDKFDAEFKNFIYDEENLSDADKEFADGLLSAYYAHESEVNNVISDLSRGYKLERLYSADKCALQLAITEMTYTEGIPLIVTINEALDLVRKYSAEESPNFVNGVLAEYKKRLEA